MPDTEPKSAAFKGADIVLFLAFALAGYLACLVLRLVEFPLWNNPALWAGGERLMATHDAYAWLAGAKGIGRYAQEPLSRLMGALANRTGLGYGEIGFWLPVLTGPLAALPLAILMTRWGVRDAIMTASLAAGGSFAFLIRTRLGYLDTDIFSLFLPELLAVGLVAWVEAFSRPGWSGPARTGYDTVNPDRVWLYAALCGVATRAYLAFYFSGYPVAVALIGMAVFVGLITADPQGRPHMLGSGMLILCGLFLDWWVIPLGLAALVILRVRPIWFRSYYPALTLFILLGFIMFITGAYQQAYDGLIIPVMNYLKPAAGPVAASILLPSPYQSVREAQNLDPSFVVDFLLGNMVVMIVFVVGLIYLTWKKPASLIFLPFLVLSLASVRLGQRFAMYIGPALALGIGAGIAMLTYRLTRSSKAVFLTQVMIFLGLFGTLYLKCTLLTPVPCLSKPLAETLIQTGRMLPQEGRLWLWWDYGYAAQYFAERDSFADGGANQGMRLYALALAHATASPLQAAQTVKYATAIQMQDYAANKTGADSSDDSFGMTFYHAGFSPFTSLPPGQAEDLIFSLGGEARVWPGDLPPQYLLVSWENLALSYWISYFGSWNVATGTSTHGKLVPLTSRLDLNLADGLLKHSNGEIPLGAAYVVESQEQKHSRILKWGGQSPYTLILNGLTRQGFLADDLIASSMLTRLLLDDPAIFAPHFHLVYDNFPWARVYLVK